MDHSDCEKDLICFLIKSYHDIPHSHLFSYIHTHRGTSWSLQWRHNEPVCVSNHQPHDCLLNRLFRRRSKETSKRRVTGLCARNSPGTGEFPAQRASNAENVSIWWRHHVIRHKETYITPKGTDTLSRTQRYRTQYLQTEATPPADCMFCCTKHIN